jgi:hypothetical protein
MQRTNNQSQEPAIVNPTLPQSSIQQMDTITYRAVIDKRQIGYLNSIIDSYEGLAVVRTLDAPAGIVELWICPPFEELVNTIINDIADGIGLKSYYKAQYRLSS